MKSAIIEVHTCNNYDECKKTGLLALPDNPCPQWFPVEDGAKLEVKPNTVVTAIVYKELGHAKNN